MAEILVIVYKEILSEFRTRYSFSTILLFIFTTISMIAIAYSSEKITLETSAGLLWIVLFFTSMIGLSRTFIYEEERGTAFLLQIIANSYSIYFGKLIFNILTSLFINFFALIFFFLFLNTQIVKSVELLLITITISSFAIATATTVISAIIAKANSKNALFPVLAFPILLPIIKIGIDLTIASFVGLPISENLGDIQMIVAYTGLIATVSYLLFDFIWKD